MRTNFIWLSSRAEAPVYSYSTGVFSAITRTPGRAALVNKRYATPLPFGQSFNLRWRRRRHLVKLANVGARHPFRIGAQRRTPVSIDNKRVTEGSDIIPPATPQGSTDGKPPIHAACSCESPLPTTGRVEGRQQGPASHRWRNRIRRGAQRHATSPTKLRPQRRGAGPRSQLVSFETV